MAVMFSDFSVGMVIISAYCAMSLLWSKIYLKEKLSLWHYLTIVVTFAGIVVLGIFSPV
jgi:drug/metabolite transporter (DMT)-like permease